MPESHALLNVRGFYGMFALFEGSFDTNVLESYCTNPEDLYWMNHDAFIVLLVHFEDQHVFSRPIKRVSFFIVSLEMTELTFSVHFLWVTYFIHWFFFCWELSRSLIRLCLQFFCRLKCFVIVCGRGGLGGHVSAVPRASWVLWG